MLSKRTVLEPSGHSATVTLTGFLATHADGREQRLFKVVYVGETMQSTRVFSDAMATAQAFHA